MQPNINNNSILFNTHSLKTPRPKRLWTTESVNLNKVTPEKFAQNCREKVDISQKATAEKTQKPKKSEQKVEAKPISAREFEESDNLVVTDENSTVLEELSKKPSPKAEERKPNNSPGVLLMDESGGVSDAEKVAGSEIPDDIIKTANHKSAVIGTFNIEWLGGCPFKNSKRAPEPRKEEDYKKLAKVIKDSDAALLGLQEVVNEEALAKVMKHLPGWGYVLSKSRMQKVGFIFDKKRVKYDANSIDVLDEAADPNVFTYDRLRAPLSVYMKVDNFDGNFVVIHNKAGFSKRSIKIREKQSEMLNKWTHKYLEKNNDKDLVILGDYNDFPGSKTLQKTAKGGVIQYAALPEDDYTNIKYGSKIDHIGFSSVDGGAGEEIKPETTTTVDEKKYPGFVKWGSDHKMVTAEFDTSKDND